MTGSQARSQQQSLVGMTLLVIIPIELRQGLGLPTATILGSVGLLRV